MFGGESKVSAASTAVAFAGYEERTSGTHLLVGEQDRELLSARDGADVSICHRVRLTVAVPFRLLSASAL